MILVPHTGVSWTTDQRPLRWTGQQWSKTTNKPTALGLKSRRTVTKWPTWTLKVIFWLYQRVTSVFVIKCFSVLGGTCCMNVKSHKIGYPGTLETLKAYKTNHLTCLNMQITCIATNHLYRNKNIETHYHTAIWDQYEIVYHWKLTRNHSRYNSWVCFVNNLLLFR